MKAHELATIAEQAVAKRNNERPAQLYKELMVAMESQAKTGQKFLSFVFSDSSEIVAAVLDLLRRDGYKVNKQDRGTIRIAWEDVNKQCGFDIAWVGPCKEPTDETGFCAKHRACKCTCGKQAKRECEATIGAFVCGHLTCGKCRHQH